MINDRSHDVITKAICMLLKIISRQCGVLLKAQYNVLYTLLCTRLCVYFTLFTLFFYGFSKENKVTVAEFVTVYCSQSFPIESRVHLNINYDKLIRRAWRVYFCAHVEQSYLNEKQII